MHYKIRYPGSRPTTSTPKVKSKHSWLHNGARMAGVHVAGQCIVCLLIFGFGLSVIGALSLLMSTSADLTDGQFKSPPAIVGCTLLASGSAFLLIGLIFFCCAAHRAKRMFVREYSAKPAVNEKYQVPVTTGTETAPNPDPAVYYITDGPVPDPQFAVQNEGYITDKVDAPDPGFTGFTYTEMGEGNDKKETDGKLEARGIPPRLPPISRDESKTVYSSPSDFGLKD